MAFHFESLPTPPCSPNSSSTKSLATRKERLLIVSNRLPVSVECVEDGQWEFCPSSGGLVTGLRGLAKGGIDFQWYGWPGMAIDHGSVPHLRKALLEQHNAVPVCLEQEMADYYYDGFSNSTIWPLFHHQLDRVLFNGVTSAAYQQANEAFAATIAPDLQDGDQIWIHDYHLMLLPLLLRQRARDMDITIHIGWFLHTPFPEKDFFDVLPSKVEIIEGILGADVIGFQTDEARDHFSGCCSHVQGYSTSNSKILCRDREVSIGTFPIGVEPSEFYNRLQTHSVQDMIRSMKVQFYGTKVIVGVDRLDCIKGIPQKLHAFDRFLERNPEWVGHAILVQVVIPSRVNLEAHRLLKLEIQQLVGEINGKYGTINYVPIHFLYSSVQPDELTALYANSDVCFITSTRDGMNLVCYEYVACHSEKAVQASCEKIPTGVLILSRYAGAANVLDGSLIVNPWDKDSCAETLAHAVAMSDGDANTRMKTLGDKVEQQTSSYWGSSFVNALERVSKSERVDIEERVEHAERTDKIERIDSAMIPSLEV